MSKRSEEEVLAAMVELQQMGEAACLNGHRPNAAALLQEWMDLPSEVSSRIRVVKQRSKGDPAWKRISIQRGHGDRPLANPYPVKGKDGKAIRTAAEASELFWGDFSKQILEDTPQQDRLIEIGELLLDGAQIELGCCGDENCHGHKIRQALIEYVEDRTELTQSPPVVDWLWDLLDQPVSQPECDEPEEPWQPPRLLDLEGWDVKAFQLLKDHWGDLAAFDVVTTQETVVITQGTTEKEFTVGRFESGAAAKAAGRLEMQFDMADRSLEGLTEQTLPEYMVRFLLWGALRAHLDQGEGPIHEQTLSEPFSTFQARIDTWREFPYNRCQKPSNDGSDWEPVTDPVEQLKWLRDWDKRGRPENDAPLVRINGQTIQADVGQMMKAGLDEIQQSGLGGADLTAKLLNLAVATGQPFHSIKKAWDEFCGGVLDKEMFVSVLDEMLKGEEPMISVEELAGPEFQKLVIDDFQRQFDCDPMLVLLTVMSAMGTVLPLGTRVRGLSHTQHWRPGVLFVMILVVSGGMKSMLLEELVEKPIVGGDVGDVCREHRDAFHRVRDARSSMQGLYPPENAAAIVEAAPEWIKSFLETPSGFDNVSKLMHVVSDFTGEGLDRNAQVNERFPGYRTGFLLTTDEGRQLMGGDRYKSGSGSAGSKYTLDKLKRAWDGKGPSAVRGNKSLERNYDRIRLGILAFIQPEVYDEIASDETDDACGFWPRFLAYEAPPVQLRDDLTPADRRHIANNSSFRGYLSKLYGAIHQLVEVPMNDGGEVEFHFSEDAENWWYQHQCQIGRESTREAASGDGVMGRLLGKLPAQVLDVALMLHLLKSIEPDWQPLPSITFNWDKDAPAKAPTKPEEIKRTIPLETVQAAYTLCRQLMLRTAKQRNRAQGDGSGDRAQFLVKVQATAQKLDPEQKGIPVGQLQKGWNGAYLKKHPETKDLIYQALGALSDRNLGELTLGTSNNRGGFRYRWIAPVAA